MVWGYTCELVCQAGIPLESGRHGAILNTLSGMNGTQVPIVWIHARPKREQSYPAEFLKALCHIKHLHKMTNVKRALFVLVRAQFVLSQKWKMFCKSCNRAVRYAI
eukprot:343690-Amphidinium_carterae.1